MRGSKELERSPAKYRRRADESGRDGKFGRRWTKKEERNAMWWGGSDGAIQRRLGAENDDDDRVAATLLQTTVDLVKTLQTTV